MGIDYEALDLNELRQEMQRVSEEPGAGQGQGEGLEKYVRLPERDGFVILRILPKRKSQQFYCVTRVHTLNNPAGRNKRTYHCPRTLQMGTRGKQQWMGDCIICKYYNDLWQKSEKLSGKAQEDLQQQARAIKPVERYYYNVIVRAEKDKDGNVKKNAGPKIYSCGKTVHAKILRAMLGDSVAGEKALGDVTHVKDGRDFRVVKKVVKGGGGQEYPNYDNSKFEEPSPLGSLDEIEKWLENMHDLQALRVVKNSDELKHALRVHLGLVNEGADAADTELEEFRTAGSAPASAAAPERVRESLAKSSSSSPEAPKDPAPDEYADEDFLKELEDFK